jgi:hypothetical protein
MQNSSLTILDLSKCKMKIETMREFAFGLATNCSLTSLKWNHNVDNDENEITQLFTHSLLVNTTLLELELTSNAIDSIGASFLSPALRINSTLTKLDLRLNKFGENEITDLITSVTKRNTLRSLKLEMLFPTFSPHQFNRILNQLQWNTSLTELLLLYGWEPASKKIDLIMQRNKHNELRKTCDLFYLLFEEHILLKMPAKNRPSMDYGTQSFHSMGAIQPIYSNLDFFRN